MLHKPERYRFKLSSLPVFASELIILHDADATFSWYESALKLINSVILFYFIIQSLAYLHAHDCSERTAVFFTCQEIF